MQYRSGEGADKCDPLARGLTHGVVNSLETVVRLY